MEVGTERIAPNGYHYIKQEDGSWKLRHHLVAEETLGRPMFKHERAYFIDNDKENFDPANIAVRTTKHSKDDRIAWLRTKIQQYTEELHELEQG